jgi:hypothetical protein
MKKGRPRIKKQRRMTRGEKLMDEENEVVEKI